MPPQTATDRPASPRGDHLRSSRDVAASVSSAMQASAVYCFRSSRTSIAGTISTPSPASSPAATETSPSRHPSPPPGQPPGGHRPPPQAPAGPPAEPVGDHHGGTGKGQRQQP